jgi:hypothetical protein
MKKQNLLYILFCIGLSLLVSSCTRKNDDSTSNKTQLSFSVPMSSPVGSAKISQGVSASVATAEIQHIVVNISGDGKTLLCDWDLSGSLSGPCQINLPNINIDVPSGNNRLIQVLLVYESSDGKTLKYGDVTSNISGTTMSLPIAVSDLGASSPFSADIKGRYLTSTGAGPTGILNIRILPAGKPSMIIMRENVFNGWFKGFMMSGLDFQYELDGNIWFGGPVRMETFIGDSDASPTVFTPDETGLAKSATNGSTVQARYVAESNRPNQYKILGFFKNPSDAGTVLTSYTTINSDCSTPEYNTCLSVYDNNYSEFRGVFGKLSSSNKSFSGFTAGVLNWKYVYGVSASEIDKVKVFKFSNMNANIGNAIAIHHELVNCSLVSQMALSNPNVTDMGEVLMSASPNYQMSGLPSINGFTEAYVTCPYKNNMPLNSGIIYSSGWLDEGKCTDCKGLAFDIPTAKYNSDFKLTTNACHPVTLKAEDSYKTPYNVASNTVVNLPTVGSLAWFTGGSCTGPVTQATIPSGASQTTFYTRATSNISPTSVAMTVVSGDANVGVPPNLGQFSSGAAYLTAVSFPDRAADVTCYPILLRRNYFNGTPDIRATSLGLTFSTIITSGTTGYVGSDPACSSSPWTATIAASLSDGTFYYRPNSAGVGTETITISSIIPDLVLPIAIGNSSALVESVEIKPDFPPLDVGQCEQMSVTLRNHNSVVVPAPTAMSFNLMAPGDVGQFYSNGSCTTSNNLVTFAVNESVQKIFFMPSRSTSGGLNIGITISGANFQMYNSGSVPSGSANLTINEPTTNSPSYVYLDIPTNLLGKSILGSHEFTGAGTSLPIPLKYSSGGYLECASDSSGSAGTYGSCGTMVSNGNFMWPLTLAQNSGTSRNYYFRISQNGGYTFYKFDPTVIFGPDFKALTCNYTVSGSINTNDSAFSSNSVVCLNANAAINYNSSSLSITSSSGTVRGIIGHSSNTSFFNGALNMVGINIGNNDSPVYIANLNFSGYDGATHIFLPSASVTVTANNNIYIIGNNFNVRGTGISLQSADPDYIVRIYNNTINLSGVSGPGVTGIYVTNNVALFINNNTINSSTTNDTFTNIGIYLDANTSGATLSATKEIKNLKFNGFGMGLKVVGYATSNYLVSNLAVSDSSFSTQGYTGIVRAPFLYFMGITSSSFDRNSVINNLSIGDGNANLVKFETLGGATVNSMSSFKDNVFVSASNGAIYGEGSPFIRSVAHLTLNLFDRNQFVLKNSGNYSTANPIYIASSKSATISTTTASTHGGNLICRNSATGAGWWNSFIAGGGSTGGSNLNFADIQTYCKNDNTTLTSGAVSAADRCTKPCSP